MSQLGIREFIADRLGDAERVGHLLQRSSLGEDGPVWVLRDVTAKQAILVIHRPVNTNPDGSLDESAGPRDGDYCRGCNANFVEEYAELVEDCPTLRAIASIDAEHTDYRPEWAEGIR